MLYRIPGGYYRAEGYIKNYNTIEEYKNVDRSNVVDLAGRTVILPLRHV
jgi:ubiquitin-like modifier-activating enzyme ATG7